jgi:hypothetical protein
MAYKKEVKLKHNERAAKVNIETGEMELIPNYIRNLPSGHSLLKYKSFSITNIDATRKLKRYFNETERCIILEMISAAELQTNSLKPLNNDTSLRQLEEAFGVNKNKIQKALKRLFDFGVYAQLNITEDKEARQYWILNPFISWRGRIKKDSIFEHFKNTDIAKLLS